MFIRETAEKLQIYTQQEFDIDKWRFNDVANALFLDGYL